MIKNSRKRWKTGGRAEEWEESWCSWEKTCVGQRGIDRACQCEGAAVLLPEKRGNRKYRPCGTLFPAIVFVAM